MMPPMSERDASDSDIPIWVLDTVTKPKLDHRNSVLIAASHGGIYAGYLAARAHARGVILNDAGIGKDQAGIGSLAYLDELGVPAATIAHISARIGDGEDMVRRGTISYVNDAAVALDCRVGEPALSCAEKMRAAATFDDDLRPYEEARFGIRAQPGEPEVWGLDSISLLQPEDQVRIVVAASHGGVLAANRAEGVALSYPVVAAVFNDAGVGADQAGISRLAAMDRTGLVGATVDCMSAWIGNARSTWESGVISHVNEGAAAFGAVPGWTCQDFVYCIIDEMSRHGG